MAGQLSSTSTFGSLISDSVGDVALSMSGRRSIADLYPHVVMKEVHEDRLIITQHPIETGTPVTDHAYPIPYTVEIRCGWSNSSAATEGFVQAVYQKLLALQAARTPFAVRTGKRGYRNMLMAGLSVETDVESEYALMVVILAHQIVITGTSVTSTGASSSSGSSSVGTVGNSPTTQIDGGAADAPTSFLSPDPDTGAVVWTNGVVPSGSLNITPSPTTPSWQSLASGLTP